MWQGLSDKIQAGDIKSLARAISLVENEVTGYEAFLAGLPSKIPADVPVIGITGPPGAGKSTLTDGLIGELVKKGKSVAVLCVDPSSPFNLGALLGDRIRMSEWYNHPRVFIRSLASRGALGGLHPKIIEITELLKQASFDYILVETVGVGQSEIEIAGLADSTVVVLVPEGGDEVQTMKAGLMEIADIFVVNKSDRPAADLFVKNLRAMLAPAFQNHSQEIPIIKTVASQKQGLELLLQEIEDGLDRHSGIDRKSWLYTERVYQVIQKRRMADISKAQLRSAIESKLQEGQFNLYAFSLSYR